MEVSGQFHAPAALSLGKESPVPIGSESGRRGEEKNLDPVGTQTPNPWPASRPVPSRYTDCAIFFQMLNTDKHEFFLSEVLEF
jgi:hypothetical protein